jgi:GNAT superfamily N-acetyltransferase
MATSTLSIQPIHTLKELREFVDFMWEIYKGDPLWVPPIFEERVARLDPARNPMLKHGELQAFIAQRDGRIVGTIAGAIDYNLKNVISDPFASFGFFECINDYAVAKALLDTVVDWARSKGQVRVRGPYNPTQNDEQGFLIEGRDRIPIIMTAHNPPWYPEFVEHYGFRKWGPDEFCYQVSTEGLLPDLSNLPPKLGRVIEAVRQRTRAQVRPANVTDWDKEVERARQVYNRALSTLADFVPLDQDEFRRQTELLRPVIDPELVLFIEIDGKTVGFGLGLPNVNEALHHADGLRHPWDYLRYLRDRRRIKGMSIKIIALEPDYWGRGLDALMYGELARQMAKRGYTWADLSLTGEDNPQTNKLAKVIGAEVYKQYRIYQLEI